MLLDYIRVFKFDGTDLTDKSLVNQDPDTTLGLNLQTDDYLYVGQRFPFTNVYAYMDTANTVTGGSLDIEYWDGTTWRNAVDILDATVSGSAMLGKSGMISWTLDDDYNWQMVTDTTDSNSPTALSGINLYDTYWVRMQPTVNLSATTDSHELGYAFTTSTQLKTIDVEIDGYLSSFEAGKTNWIPEIMTASKMLVTDLKRLGLIVHPGQIIELEDVYLPATYKALELIYFNLGPSYNEKRTAVNKAYKDALNIRRYTFDTNADGKLQQSEIKNQIRRLVR